jgi:membrane-associated phospholipid phosphatase
MDWELITNITLVISILSLAVFALLGLYQWITRKSLKKVDARLLCVPIPLLIMVGIYFLFNNVLIINTRPDGSGVSSFPSSHVMTVATIFFIITIMLPKYIKSRATRTILDIIMVILISLTCVGRVLSGLHYPIDVIGALAFAFIFSEIYYLMIHKIEKGKRHAKPVYEDN